MHADRVFDALASGARRRMLRALAEGERSTTELAAHLGVSAPAVSRHLSLLEHAGVVTSRREGQRVLYGLVRDTLMEALAGFAAELAAGARAAPARKPREAI
jgi:ArsR family transcriptional regulator, arsenate/arsenite/antimonite-responsive transcriptional repressor